MHYRWNACRRDALQGLPTMSDSLASRLGTKSARSQPRSRMIDPLERDNAYAACRSQPLDRPSPLRGSPPTPPLSMRVVQTPLSRVDRSPIEQLCAVVDDELLEGFLEKVGIPEGLETTL